MNRFTPIIGPTWSEATKSYVENRDEQNSRFSRAQSGMLFSWCKCLTCGKVFRKQAGHVCKPESN